MHPFIHTIPVTATNHNQPQPLLFTTPHHPSPLISTLPTVLVTSSISAQAQVALGCGDPATNDSIPVVSNNSIVANKDASGRRLLGTPVDVYANCTGMYPSKGAMYGALALFILVLVLWAFVGECMPRRKMAAGNAHIDGVVRSSSAWQDLYGVTVFFLPFEGWQLKRLSERPCVLSVQVDMDRVQYLRGRDDEAQPETKTSPGQAENAATNASEKGSMAADEGEGAGDIALTVVRGGQAKDGSIAHQDDLHRLWLSRDAQHLIGVKDPSDAQARLAILGSHRAVPHLSNGTICAYFESEGETMRAMEWVRARKVEGLARHVADKCEYAVCRQARVDAEAGRGGGEGGAEEGAIASPNGPCDSFVERVVSAEQAALDRAAAMREQFVAGRSEVTSAKVNG